MNSMKRVFVTFLAFLVILPSLACAMPVCAMSQPVSPQMPCHDQMDEGQGDLDSIMLLQDCMGIDIQVAETIPEWNSKDQSGFDISSAIVIADFSAIFSVQRSPRAPPLQQHLFPAEPSIVLTTQRFRI